MISLLSLALTLLLNTGVALSAPVAKMTAVVDYAPHILVDIDAGDLRIETWPYDKVSLTSDVASSDVDVSLDQTKNNVAVFAKVDTSSDLAAARPGKYILYVPASAVIDVFMADGNVAVNGVYGPVSVNVGSGNITLDNVSNSTEVRTTNGLVTTVSHEADPFE